MHVLKACLTKLACKFIVTVEDRLHQLTFEAVRLCVHRLQMTPEAHHMATDMSDTARAGQQLAECDLAALCVSWRLCLLEFEPQCMLPN